jgi:1D-myo-inositol 3-kinase
VKGFTVAGHIAVDDIITDDGLSVQLGGPPCYAAVLGTVLKFPVKTVTRIGEDFPEVFQPILEDIGVTAQRSHISSTTKFVIDYRYNPRRMSLPSICEPISLKEIEKADRLALCPIANEINPQMMMSLTPSLLALDPQGLLRKVGQDGLVLPKKWMNSVLFEKLDILKTSSSEHTLITGMSDIRKSLGVLKRYGVKNAVITIGKGGSYVSSDSGIYHIPAYPVKEVDPTGAGDVFMAALAAFFDESIEWACAVGSAASSALVETQGVNIEVDKKTILERSESIFSKVRSLG